MSQGALVAPLEAEWLRERIESITYKYTTRPRHPWTMLAIVAAVPPPDQVGVPQPDAEWSSSEIEHAMDNLFSALRIIEDVGLSVVYPETAVTPISLYVT